MRVYSAIEPEMSASTTSGGCRSAGERNARSIEVAAGAQRRRASCARGSIAAAARIGLEAPRARPCRTGSRRPAIAASRVGDLGRRHLREILRLAGPRAGDGEAGVDLDLGDLLRRCSSAAASNSASATRRPPASGFCFSRVAPGATGDIMRDHLLDQRARAPEQPEGLVEDGRCPRAASRARRAASSRNRRACRCRRPRTASIASITEAGPTGMPALRSARAK